MSAPVAILFDRLGPYHVARIAAAAAAYPTVAIEFGRDTVSYAWDHVETSAFERYTIAEHGHAEAMLRLRFARRLFSILDQCDPRALALPGWYHFGSLLALVWAVRRERPAVMMSETQATDEPRVWWKEIVKRRVVGLCASALVGGQRHAAYMHDLGMEAAHTFTGYDVVDNEYFASRANEVRRHAALHRARLKLPARYFLSSSRFIAKKNLPHLLRAFARFSRRPEANCDPVKLVILGDGPLRGELEALRSALDLERDVLLPGFQQYAEIPAFYALAEAFVHVSTVEQWGLVVNEAAAAQLPLLVSRACGCVPELVRDGQNGFSFDPQDEAGLADAMAMLASDSALRERFGARSRQLVEALSPAFFASQLRLAVDAPRRPRRSARRTDLAMLTALSMR